MAHYPPTDSPPRALSPINTHEFLPPVNRWVAAGSWFIVFAVGGAIAASFSVKYRTTVKAPGIIRPAGEPRLVQSTVAGTVTHIAAANNTAIQQGDPIAQLDIASQAARGAQLLANLEQGKSRLAQTQAQLTSADQQIAAEIAQAQRAIAASTADYDQALSANQVQSATARAAVQEAQAQVALATQEIESFRQLVDSGAVSRLQLTEKQAALQTAQARLASMQATLNPATGSVKAAHERIAEAKASGAATLARLQQSKQQLVQQGLEIQEQLQTTEQELAQVKLNLENAVVRSPITGTLHELNLRNTGQVVSPGETLAKVIPAAAPLEIKAMVPAQQINKVKVGYPAQMRVSACPFSEFGTVTGQVKAISPDTVTQPLAAAEAAPASTPSAFYSVILSAASPVLQSSTGQTQCTLQPGTEGRVTIISREETIITFLRRKAGLLTDF
ncbi:MAG: HlyD family efflux transporter periplasmic adaptor subunit [Cyanobacteria bacterium J06607_13]